MTISLREFTLSDYDAVYALWQNAGPGIGIGRSDTHAEIAKKLERDPDLFLLAVEGETIVGTVIGGYDGRRGIIYHLAVAANYRQRGIGHMLMTQVERRLIAKGCIRSYLLVAEGNEEVIEWYRDLGWDTMHLTVMAKTIA